MSNLKLASEATCELDFGSGTKVRIGNSIVTLKGKFYRDDSYFLRQHVESTNSLRKITKVLDDSSVTTNAPTVLIDKHGFVGARVQLLVNSRDFQESEKNKLLNMVAERDSTLAQQACKYQNTRDQIINILRDTLFRVLGVMVESEKR